ncbi:hypothetical protein [Paenibacillus apiarius]|nr:hypothetical protein [Paenibacillus apiarius]MBN3526623.1 hypothetical protein [Paenibacillus apiarius]
MKWLQAPPEQVGCYNSNQNGHAYRSYCPVVSGFKQQSWHVENGAY